MGTLKSYCKKIIFVFIICLIVFNYIQGFSLIKTKKFDEDEFEHAHIAWCIKENNMTIYKDFFEHHGPIYPYLNIFSWKLFKPSSAKNILFLFRYQNFVLSIILAILVFFIAMSFMSKYFSSIVVLLLSTNSFFQKAAWEIRTDNLLHCFWLGSVLVLIYQFKKNRKNISLFVGLLWGLAVFTMVKSMMLIGPFFLGLCILNKKRINNFIKKDFLLLFSGFCLVFLLFLFFAIKTGSLKEFLFYQFVVNFIIQIYSKTPINYLFKEFFQLNYFLVFILFISTFFLKRIYLQLKKHKIITIYFLTAVIPLFLVLGPSYHHDYMMFIIPVIIFSVLSMKKLFESVKYSQTVFLLLAIIFIANYYLVFRINRSIIVNRENLRQIKFLKKIEEVNLSEKKPVLYFWGKLGGYPFFPHLNYFWYMDDFSQKVSTILTGYNVYDNCLDNLIKMKQKPLVIIDEDEWNFLPEKLKLILRANYFKDKDYPLYYYKQR